LSSTIEDRPTEWQDGRRYGLHPEHPFAWKDGLMFIASPALLLAASLSISVAERLPDFDTRRNCETEMRAIGNSQAQGVQQCIADEMSARAEIESHWADFSAGLRDLCIAETQVGGGPSYVDVLECLRFGARRNPG